MWCLKTDESTIFSIPSSRDLELGCTAVVKFTNYTIQTAWLFWYLRSSHNDKCRMGRPVNRQMSNRATSQACGQPELPCPA